MKKVWIDVQGVRIMPSPIARWRRPINPMNQHKGLITLTSIRPITLSGYVAESGTATPSVTFRVVDQFGRFPHRNEVLGRPSTPAEIEFLSHPGSGF